MTIPNLHRHRVRLHPIYVSLPLIIDIFTSIISDILSVIALFTLIFPNITSKILNESLR
jgi:hypothetical protein